MAIHIFNPEHQVDNGRYTSENAANKIGNRYDMVLVATARARELKKEKHSLAKSQVVPALKDVEDGVAGREYLVKHAKGERFSRHHKNG